MVGLTVTTPLQADLPPFYGDGFSLSPTENLYVDRAWGMRVPPSSLGAKQWQTPLSDLHVCPEPNDLSEAGGVEECLLGAVPDDFR